ncbi:hypothetical protein C8F01DRAFT_1090060 [Mycena amicta]|nr:hypothetical protein C8F01DRAFT_1090060 [Mycena amicta]
MRIEEILAAVRHVYQVTKTIHEIATGGFVSETVKIHQRFEDVKHIPATVVDGEIISINLLRIDAEFHLQLDQDLKNLADFGLIRLQSRATGKHLVGKFPREIGVRAALENEDRGAHYARHDLCRCHGRLPSARKGERVFVDVHQKKKGHRLKNTLVKVTIVWNGMGTLSERFDGGGVVHDRERVEPGPFIYNRDIASTSNQQDKIWRTTGEPSQSDIDRADATQPDDKGEDPMQALSIISSGGTIVAIRGNALAQRTPCFPRRISRGSIESRILSIDWSFTEGPAASCLPVNAGTIEEWRRYHFGDDLVDALPRDPDCMIVVNGFDLNGSTVLNSREEHGFGNALCGGPRHSGKRRAVAFEGIRRQRLIKKILRLLDSNGQTCSAHVDSRIFAQETISIQEAEGAVKHPSALGRNGMTSGADSESLVSKGAANALNNGSKRKGKSRRGRKSAHNHVHEGAHFATDKRQVILTVNFDWHGRPTTSEADTDEVEGEWTDGLLQEILERQTESVGMRNI